MTEERGTKEHRSTMASSRLHESPEELSPETREMHRAIVSLMEELEAIDWYGQRVDATSDDELERVLAHNRDEEKEHACMTLEWMRRRDPVFDRFLRQFLFSSEPIVESEHGDDDMDSSLGIGSLRTGGTGGEEEGK
jgi:ferritin-like protein